MTLIKKLIVRILTWIYRMEITVTLKFGRKATQWQIRLRKHKGIKDIEAKSFQSI
jgi:hypothetical protein